MKLFEYVKRIPGHKNSKGELAPWTIVSHETGKIISSHKTKKAAEEHLKWMNIYSKRRSKMESVDEELVDGNTDEIVNDESSDEELVDENTDEIVDDENDDDDYEEDKYEITDTSIVWTDPDGRKHELYRIRASKNFGDVKKGDIGGWIEKEENLDQYDNCWVGGDAKVFGDAQVSDNATVYGKAQVYGDAQVFGDAKIYGNARVYEDAYIRGKSKIHGNAEVYGNAAADDNADIGNDDVPGNTKVHGNATIHGCASVYGDAEVKDNAEVGESESENAPKVYGKAKIYWNAKVYGNAKVHDTAKVYDDAKVYGNAKVHGKSEVFGKSNVFGVADVSGNAWIRGNARVNYDISKGTTSESKYELIDETKTIGDHTLYRIRATKTFKNVKKGDIGGWIESEKNLSHGDDCWIYDDATVYGNAIVCDYATVRVNASVHTTAADCKVIVCDHADIGDDAIVTGNSTISGAASVFGGAQIGDDSGNGFIDVSGKSKIFGHARVYENSKVGGTAVVCGNAILVGDNVFKGIRLESIEPNKNDMLFIESMAKLGMDKAQMEAVIMIHNAMYPEMSIDEGVIDTIKDIGKAGLVAGALMLGNPGDANAANNDNSAISRQTPTEQVMQQDQEGAKLFAEQIKQLNGIPYAIGKGVSKNASMASEKAMVDASVKANNITKGDGSASSFKTGVNGDVKIIAQKNLRDKDGKWVSYALCSIN